MDLTPEGWASFHLVSTLVVCLDDCTEQTKKPSTERRSWADGAGRSAAAKFAGSGERRFEPPRISRRAGGPSGGAASTVCCGSGRHRLDGRLRAGRSAADAPLVVRSLVAESLPATSPSTRSDRRADHVVTAFSLVYSISTARCDPDARHASVRFSADWPIAARTRVTSTQLAFTIPSTASHGPGEGCDCRSAASFAPTCPTCSRCAPVCRAPVDAPPPRSTSAVDLLPDPSRALRLRSSRPGVGIARVARPAFSEQLTRRRRRAASRNALTPPRAAYYPSAGVRPCDRRRTSAGDGPGRHRERPVVGQHAALVHDGPSRCPGVVSRRRGNPSRRGREVP